MALKVLDPSLAIDDDMRARFAREADIMTTVASPNCVAVYGHGDDEIGAWIAMEYIHGADLRTVLAISGRLTPAQACGVLTGALTGLSHAHSVGVIHRDVKPENILVDAAGVSKLTDFGLVVRRTDPATWRPLEGSPSYMSPEQVRCETLDTRSDLYAAGAVLYELLAGRRPYEAESQMALLHAHVSGPLPSMRGLPNQVGKLLRRALAKDPDDRPATAEAFAAELKDAASHDLGSAWLVASGIAGLVAGAVAADVATAAPAHATLSEGAAVTERTTTAAQEDAPSAAAAESGGPIAKAIHHPASGRSHRVPRTLRLIKLHPLWAAGVVLATIAVTATLTTTGAIIGRRVPPTHPTPGTRVASRVTAPGPASTAFPVTGPKLTVTPTSGPRGIDVTLHADPCPPPPRSSQPVVVFGVEETATYHGDGTELAVSPTGSWTGTVIFPTPGSPFEVPPPGVYRIYAACYTRPEGAAEGTATPYLTYPSADFTVTS